MRFCYNILWFWSLMPLLLASCVNNRANADIDSGKAFNAIALVGKYEGNLPCADCSSISTTLVLNQDRTYSLHYMYVGKSDQQFVKTGNWKVVVDVLQLDNEDYDYKIAENKLIQLDLSGKDMTGDLAGKYTLSKIRR